MDWPPFWKLQMHLQQRDGQIRCPRSDKGPQYEKLNIKCKSRTNSTRWPAITSTTDISSLIHILGSLDKTTLNAKSLLLEESLVKIGWSLLLSIWTGSKSPSDSNKQSTDIDCLAEILITRCPLRSTTPLHSDLVYLRSPSSPQAQGFLSPPEMFSTEEILRQTNNTYKQLHSILSIFFLPLQMWNDNIGGLPTKIIIIRPPPEVRKSVKRDEHDER